MPRRRLLYVSLIILSVTALLVTWIAGLEKEPRVTRPETKSLYFYRQQFRRSDGSLPADDELRQILQAKGIAYHEPCSAGQDCSSGAPAALPLIPEVDFSAAGLSAARQDELRVAITTTLSSAIDALRAINPELRLESVAVDSAMKLRLYFNKDFAQIADDETRLNDFSEGLHDLAMAGLRGSVIYIAGQPLGQYLQKKDAEQNQKARAESPDNGAEGRR